MHVHVKHCHVCIAKFLPMHTISMCKSKHIVCVKCIALGTRVCICLFTYSCIYTYAYVFICTWMCIHLCVSICILCLYVYTYMKTYFAHVNLMYIHEYAHGNVWLATTCATQDPTCVLEAIWGVFSLWCTHCLHEKAPHVHGNQSPTSHYSQALKRREALQDTCRQRPDLIPAQNPAQAHPSFNGMHEKMVFASHSSCMHVLYIYIYLIQAHRQTWYFMSKCSDNYVCICLHAHILHMDQSACIYICMCICFVMCGDIYCYVNVCTYIHVCISMYVWMHLWT